MCLNFNLSLTAGILAMWDELKCCMHFVFFIWSELYKVSPKDVTCSHSGEEASQRLILSVSVDHTCSHTHSKKLKLKLWPVEFSLLGKVVKERSQSVSLLMDHWFKLRLLASTFNTDFLDIAFMCTCKPAKFSSCADFSLHLPLFSWCCISSACALDVAQLLVGFLWCLQLLQDFSVHVQQLLPVLLSPSVVIAYTGPVYLHRKSGTVFTP